MKLLLASVVLASAFCYAQDEPRITKVEPRSVQPGDVIEITGELLGRDVVDEVYLTDHKIDVRLKTLEQKPTTIKVRVPDGVPPGRMQLMVLTKGDDRRAEDPKLLELPAFVVVEERTSQVVLPER